jgi:hypothetical protein
MTYGQMMRLPTANISEGLRPYPFYNSSRKAASDIFAKGKNIIL